VLHNCPNFFWWHLLLFMQIYWLLVWLLKVQLRSSKWGVRLFNFYLTHCISDEFKQYARQKSEYSYVFRRQGEEEKKAANKLQVCDYNNGNYKTKAEWSIIHRCVQWTKLSVWCSKLFLQILLDWNCASVLCGKFYRFTC